MATPLVLIKSRPQPAGPPDQLTYVALARNDLIALMHGLPDGQALAWMRIIAESLSLAVSTLPDRRCAEIGGRHWMPLKARLLHARRIAVEADEIRIIWVEEAISSAVRRIKTARNRGGSRGRNAE